MDFATEDVNEAETASIGSYDGRNITLDETKNFDGQSMQLDESDNYDGRSITVGEAQNYDGHSITGESCDGKFIQVGEPKNHDGRSITVGQSQNYDGHSITGDSYDGRSITMSEYERSIKPEGEGKVWLSRRRSMTVEGEDHQNDVEMDRQSFVLNSRTSLQLHSHNGSLQSLQMISMRRRSTLRGSMEGELSHKKDKKVKGQCCVLL